MSGVKWPEFRKSGRGQAHVPVYPTFAMEQAGEEQLVCGNGRVGARSCSLGQGTEGERSLNNLKGRALHRECAGIQNEPVLAGFRPASRRGWACTFLILSGTEVVPAGTDVFGILRKCLIIREPVAGIEPATY